MIEFIDTSKLNEDEWLRLRGKTVGGSDAAAACEESRWKSAYELWMEKTGRVVPDREQFDLGGKHESAYWGRTLEAHVADAFQQLTGIKVEQKEGMYRNSKYPWAHANIDRELPDIPNAGLECKAVGRDATGWGNDSVPLEYYYQAQHYMMVLERDTWYFAVLFGGQKFDTRVVKRDNEFIRSMADKENALHVHICHDTPPPVPDDADSELLGKIYPSENGEIVALGDSFDAVFDEYIEAQRDEEAAKTRKEKARALLQKAIKDASGAATTFFRATWKPQNRTVYDHDAMSRDGIDLNKYAKVSTSRVFRVKEVE